MRIPLVLLFLAFLSVAMFLFAQQPCIECDELSGLPTARLFAVLEKPNDTLEMTAFFENSSATPSRQPIRDSILIVELTNSTTLKELYLVYTDSEGKSGFDYSNWRDGCINFRVLYCPFCIPGSPECGFQECLKFANIDNESGSYENIAVPIKNITDIPDGPMSAGYTKPSTLNESRYLPNIGTKDYCPPPPSLKATPALCLPLLVIFALLAGSLYYTGRNPFAGFSLGTPRIGRHIRYQARGRSFSQSVKSFVMSVKAAAEEKKTGGAKPSWFLFDQVMNIVDTVAGSEKGESEGGKQISTALGLSSGRRKRPGLKKAWQQMKMSAREGMIRSYGARGERTGLWGTMKNLGVEVAVGFATIGAALYDNSWIGWIVGVPFTGKGLSEILNDAVSGSDRYKKAQFLARAEALEDVAGRFIKPPMVKRKEGVEKVEIEVGEKKGTLENVRINEDGKVECTVKLEDGTTYNMVDKKVTSIGQVVGKGTSTEMTVHYVLREADGKTVLDVAGVVSAGGQKMDVVRDASGRVSQIGDIKLERDKSGQITGMYDVSLPGKEGQVGREAQKGSDMYNSISSFVSNDGLALDSGKLSGISYMNAKDLGSMVTSARDAVNKNYESVSVRYMEGKGLVEVTDRDMLKGSKGGDYTVKVLKSDYTPQQTMSAEEVGKLMKTPQAELTMKDGQYTSAKVGGKEVGFDVQRDKDGTIRSTVVKGTNIVVGWGDTRSAKGADGSDVRPSMNEFQSRLSDYNQERASYMKYKQETQGTAVFSKERPGLVEPVKKALEMRKEMGETFTGNMEAKGVSGDALTASKQIYNSTAFSNTETSYAGKVLQAQKEYDDASTKLALGKSAKVTPLAEAYEKAAGKVEAMGLNVNSSDGRLAVQREMRGDIDRIWKKEDAQMRKDLTSPDASVRTAAEQRMQQSVYSENANTNQVIRTRIAERTDAAMAGSAHMLTDEPPGSEKHRVASHLLGLGTGLASMSKQELDIKVNQAIAADPGIQDPAAARKAAEQMYGRAREVANTYKQAQAHTTQEYIDNKHYYVSSDLDKAYAGIAKEKYVQKNQINEKHLVADASHYFNQVSSDTNAATAFSGYAKQYGERYLRNPADNPLGLNRHQVYSTNSIPPGQPGVIDPRSAYGYVAADSVISAGAAAYGAKLPPETYQAALNARIYATDPSVESQRKAQEQLTRAVGFVKAYDENADMSTYPKVRDDIKAKTGIDIGPYKKGK